MAGPGSLGCLGMQNGLLGLNWTHSVGAVAGCALVVGALFAVVKLKQRRRDARKERPPQEEKILRPAGYYAMERLGELDEKTVGMLTRVLVAGMVFGIMGGAFWPLLKGLALGQFTPKQIWAEPKSEILIAGILMAVAALIWCIRELQLFWKLEEQRRAWRFGLRGEQSVAEKLASREVAAADYTVFHDVPVVRRGKNFNIDHVVVGPGGVFVLETKARARRKATGKQEEHKVYYDGETLTFPWCYDKDAVRQVEGNAEWVREFLQAYAPKGLMIQPVIVVPGWFVESKGNYAVKAMNGDYLAGYLKRAKRIYEPEQLEAVIKRLDEKCRELEF